MNYNFTSPTICGVICENISEIPAALFREFKKTGKSRVLLPFQIEKKFLKNTVTCMKLMDIAALVIVGSDMQKAMLKYVKTIDPTAKKMGKINLVIKQRNKFYGYNISDKAGLFCHTLINLLTKPGKTT